MKSALIKIATAIGVMLVAACAAHIMGVKSWETSFSIGFGAAVASLLSDWRRNRKLSRASDRQN